MIREEQKELADYVKRVHLSLRCKTRQMGAEKAWEEHLQNEEVLCKYAFSMKKLAEDYWSVNNHSDTEADIKCRIDWIVNYIMEYFQKGLMENELEKEVKKVEIFFKKQLINEEEYLLCKNYRFEYKKPFKLLDVGSCYNPFGKFDFLNVYPIDLYPAIREVKKCNFIKTQVVDSTSESWFHDDLTLLPSSFFDAVVFSLFLEYLPSPKQRHVSCLNAYKCLKTNGLLVIVTPDSKHASANAHIMKSWKIAAGKIGFVRTCLEKLRYLYCMAFRKSVSGKYPLLLYNQNPENINAQDMFVIPQDSVEYKTEEKIEGKNEEDEKGLREMFTELPFS